MGAKEATSSCYRDAYLKSTPIVKKKIYFIFKINIPKFVIVILNSFQVAAH